MSDSAKTEACGPTTEAHDRFKPFAGTFDATVKLWMGPGEPNVTSGVMTNELVLGGRYLRHTFIGARTPDGSTGFEGTGFWGFNTTTGKYEGVWIDNASTSMQTEIGDVDSTGTVWTMTGEVIHPQTNQPLAKKSVITLVDNDHHRMESFFPGPDGTEFKAMEIEYVRSGG